MNVQVGCEQRGQQNKQCAAGDDERLPKERTTPLAPRIVTVPPGGRGEKWTFPVGENMGKAMERVTVPCNWRHLFRKFSQKRIKPNQNDHFSFHPDGDGGGISLMETLPDRPPVENWAKVSPTYGEDSFYPGRCARSGAQQWGKS